MERYELDDGHGGRRVASCVLFLLFASGGKFVRAGRANIAGLRLQIGLVSH
jgi:hypothetical protein